MKNQQWSLLVLLLAILISSCGGNSSSQTGETTTPPKPMVAEEEPEETDPMKNKGIGPISSVELGEIDEAMVAEGKKIYEQMCTACHKIDKKYIGPSPKGILSRRSPEWIMNMILNPVEMIEKDPIARQLLAEANGAPMANQGLTEEQARQILEYFRTLE
ncbi:cytochrome c [Fulvivirgaceae bacterium BMA10]|uniref:Cytochrome c n=1 Tax=Splendidivirga corallicola TaxID=3051826 RepID=A0ABT8KY03_9BACT|nr:cytochrome c [Fulvivirgaceae bacterium BMA10]